MRRLLAVLPALLMALALAVPASAAGDDRQTEPAPAPRTGGDTGTLTFQLTLNGEVPQGDIFVLEYPYPSGQSFGDIVFCGSADTGECIGGGTVFTASVEAAVGSSEKFAFGRLPGGGSAEIFHEGAVVADGDKTFAAHYNFQGDEQTGGNEQTGGKEQTGGNNQKGDMVTKTFELTLNGEVPAGESFTLSLQSEMKYNEGEGEFLIFCTTSDEFPQAEPCTGSTTYSQKVTLPKGDTIRFTFYRGIGPGLQFEAFRSGTETISEDATNSAYYTFSGAENKQGGNQQNGGNEQTGETVTKTFELTLRGDVPAGESFSVGIQSELKYNEGEGELLLFCSDSDDATIPEDVEPCQGNGAVYRLSVELPKGDTLRSTFYRGFGAGPNTEAFHSETETINQDTTNAAYYDFGGDEQTGGNKQPGDTVTKTFKLTLNGDVADGQAFAVKYGPQIEGETRVLVFCGEPVGLETFPGYETKGECAGDGTVYTESVELPKGSTIFSVFVRYSDGSDYITEEVFHESNGGETLNSDMTNAASYTFAAGNNRQVQPTPTQGTGGTNQSGQTWRMPTEMPVTGAGGLQGSGFPVAQSAVMLSLIGAGAYGLLRRV